MIRAELHCHNTFSNNRFGAGEPPYDCNVTIPEQLLGAQAAGLDAIFVTNHNTLDGYAQALEYARSHERFGNMTVYPAEEVTAGGGAHVLAYGIRESVPAGLELEEIIETVHSQGGIVSAAHPFSIIDGLCEDAAKCDMIEVFNSNNVDYYSNARAAEFAKSRGMIRAAGSDSHVASSIGRCVNSIDSENALDDVLHAMGRGRIAMSSTGYVRRGEVIENLRYKIGASRKSVARYMTEKHPAARLPLDLLLRLYEPDSPLWPATYCVALYFLRRISRQVNANGARRASGRRDLAGMARLALKLW